MRLINFTPLRDKKYTLSNSFLASQISYHSTGYFSKIVTDYISGNPSITFFYNHNSDLQGIQNAIVKRKAFKTDRKLLVEQLQLQYASQSVSKKVKSNLDMLLQENTFTVCTAHQPNIFTGHLYFIYKIIHAIKLSETLNKALPENNFVPVFYMGSEDADIEELGHIFIHGKKYDWNTKQTGAVGRMVVDDELVEILKNAEGQLSVEPFGKEVIELMRQFYTKGTTIQNASFGLINTLFGDSGLIVLLPDNAALKQTMLPIFEDDIFNNTPFEIVSDTSKKLSEQYKIQAHPREINLFYLKEDIRSRIEYKIGKYKILNNDIEFDKEELKIELVNHPERFSPNVILRALYQETILPNVAFIGGGGELAYWLELKALFQQNQIPFPVLIIRNSFLFTDKNTEQLIKKHSLSSEDIFRSDAEIVKQLVKERSKKHLNLESGKKQISAAYGNIKSHTSAIDSSLNAHTESLLAKALKKLDQLESKMLKAEKRKFADEERQVKKIKNFLFPNGELQERVENFMPFYAKYGKDLFKIILENSLALEQKFTIISEDHNTFPIESDTGVI